MTKKILSLLLICLILTALPITAFAHEVPDVTRDDCSINVVLWDNQKNKGIVGAELVCYRIGYVDHDNDQNYYFYDILTREIIPESTIRSTSAPAEYAKLAKNGSYTEKYKEHFEKEGTYYFKDLPTGLYVVTQVKAAKGYSNMMPFLVSVPYMEDGEYVYEVTAKVKTELKQEIKPTTPATCPTTPGPKLPQTGQLTWPIPWLASSGMLMFAFGWWLCFGRRKDSYED